MRRQMRFALLGLVAVMVCCALLFSSKAAYAENRWIDDTFSTDLNMVLRDEIRDRVYLADSGNGNLVIVDSVTEEVIGKLPVAGTIMDLAISKNNNWLAIATKDGISRVQLNELTLQELQIPDEIKGKIQSVAYHHSNGIFVSTIKFSSEYDQRGYIYLLSPNGKKIVKRFGTGASLSMRLYQGLLKTDSTGTILYVAEQGLSPCSVHKFDVTDRKKPQFLLRSAHTALGSYVKDFSISPRYNEIYLVCGAPYGVEVVDSETLELIELLETGPYGGGVDVSRYGDRIYAAPSNTYNNYLYKFDADPLVRDLIEAYELDSEAYNGKSLYRGLAVDRFAEKAFIIHGDTHPSYREMKLQVVDIAE